MLIKKYWLKKPHISSGVDDFLKNDFH